MIIKVQFPQKSSSDTITFAHMFYIYATKHNFPIDITSALLLYMQEFRNKPILGIPYGQLVTFILSLFAIPLTDLSLPSTSAITLTTLNLGHISWDRHSAGWH